MKVQRIQDIINRPFTIKDLCSGYTNDDDGSTTDKLRTWDGKLNIRPSFQRNSVYDNKRRDAVIQTILDECPLNIMYFVDCEDGTYEVLDGQQRILSICNFIAGEFSISSSSFPPSAPQQDFPNLQMNLSDIAEKILNYQLDVYVCMGTPSEKNKWFHTINTAGEPLNEQELRNASHTGAWLLDAKSRFSSATGRGVELADNNPNTHKEEKLLTGSWNRQDYLQTALTWAANADGISVEDYMLKHRGDQDASELWQYFSKVLEWVRDKFVAYNSAMKGIDWGEVYEEYQAGALANNIIAKSSFDVGDIIGQLEADDEVTANFPGIYKYVIWGRVRDLQIRQFDQKTIMTKYEEQHHHCIYCEQEGNMTEYMPKELHADHIKPWSKGGKTVIENCQLLCAKHNEEKGDRY